MEWWWALVACMGEGKKQSKGEKKKKAFLIKTEDD